MVTRSYNMPEDEPFRKEFEKPSETEHLLQIVNVWTIEEPHPSINLTENEALCKLEVVGGDENGRSMLHRVSLDDEWKGFFRTRQFLKVIGEPCKGEVDIDTIRWIGRQFYATVKHEEGSNGKVYANIAEFNDQRTVDQFDAPKENDNPVNWEE